MSLPFLSSFALAIVWMISPESLVLLATMVGQHGPLSLGLLTLFGLLSLSISSLLHHSALPKVEEQEPLVMTAILGPATTTTLILAARVPLLLFVSTGVLVTAGFVFNETFFYWFPNFAFAFLLLVLLSLCNILQEQLAMVLQLAFTAIAILGLLLLAIIGLTFPAPHAPVAETAQPSLATGMTTLLLFLGYDLAPRGGPHNRQAPLSALAVGFGLFFLWALIFQRTLPLSTLADSTIAHILVAKGLLGQTGRWLIGLVVIAGACALVNGLFIHTARTLVNMARCGLIAAPASSQSTRWVLFTTLGATIALLMFTGLAGDPLLETYIRGALLLWLLLVCSRCFAVTHFLGSRRHLPVVHGYLLSLGLLLAIVVLIITDSHSLELFVFCTTFFAMTMISAAIRQRLHSRR